MTIAFLLLLAQSSMAADDALHRITVAQAATTAWTHVCVEGTLTRRRKESDGDWHLRIEDRGHFLIAEVIPQIPLTPPRTGTRVEVCGITRYDKRHKWPEVHPVLTLRWGRDIGKNKKKAAGFISPETELGRKAIHARGYQVCRGCGACLSVRVPSPHRCPGRPPFR